MSQPLRKFKPVKQNIERPKSLRQSVLAQFDKCPRSGYLSLKYGGGVGTHAQARGTAFHAMAETATKMMIAQGEARIPPELARDIMAEILLTRTDLVIPVEEHESLRQMAWNWAKGTVINLDTIRSVERRAVMQIGDWTLHGALDLLYVDGRRGEIHDYKTGFVMPKQETFERQFQGQFYALLVVEGRWEDNGERVARNIDEVLVRQIYPRHYDEARAALAERAASYEKADLLDFRFSVKALLEQIDYGLRTGDYPAVPGDHCGLCPAAHECPIPQEFRGASSVTSMEEAMDAVALADALTAEATRLKGYAKVWAEKTGVGAIPLAPDSDMEYALTIVHSESVKDKAALKAALAGTNKNPESFFSQRTSTKFVKRRRKDR